MARTQARITVEKVTEISQKLRDLPAPDRQKRQITKQESVRLLIKDIKHLRERGYTLHEIAELLSKEGLTLSAASLGNYIQRATPKPARAAKSAKQHNDTPRAPARQEKAASKDGSFAIREDTQDI
jgi:DNA-binding transcriptional MerR regulator